MIPKLWMRLMTEMFGTSATLASKLWRTFAVTPTLLYLISQCDHAGRADHATLMQRFDRLITLVTPAALMTASLLVSPEDGRQRSREAVRFEERVLMRTDNCGCWK